MITPLLTTKLHIPPLRESAVSRPRLTEKLDGGLRPGHRLTLLSAPAGYGKTTLLSAWASQCGQPIAWLSLDADDNDLTRFLSYLVAALRTVQEQVGESVLAALRSPALPGTGTLTPKTLLSTLINEIAALDLPHFGLVLDDLHAITEESIHQALTFILDNLPAHMHLIVATRADPPLPLSRLRGHGQLIELRAADLSFTQHESVLFLNQAMGLDLTPQETAALDAQTEGWAVGLQMAALALRAQGRGPTASPAERTRSDLLAGLAQTRRYMLDYLADEVFADQPETIRAFLLRTSIVDRLCGSLCDTLMEVPPASQPAMSGQETLLHLERANLFVALLDDHLAWYRYHPLFADLLRKRLMQAQPELVPLLHVQASTWYEQCGLAAEAIEHALAAQDAARAASLVEQRAEATLMRSENATVLRWIESLPDELILARPSLCVYHAWALLLNGRSPEVIELRLQQANQEAAGDDVKGAIVALRALLAILQGRVPESVRLAHQALDHLSPQSLFLRSVAADVLGMAHAMSGDIPAAQQAFARVVDVAQQAGNVMMAVAALCNLAGLRLLQGQLHLAEADYRQALALSSDRRGRRLPVAARALMGLGELAREWNDLEDAAHHLTKALHLCDQYGEMGSLFSSLSLAHVRLAQGKEQEAQELLRQARQLAAASRTTQMDDLLVAAAQARMWVDLGRLDMAERWARGRGLDAQSAGGGQPEDSPSDYNLHELEHVVLARLYLAQGQPQRALPLLRSLVQTAEQLGRMRRLIELLGLEAVALQMSGQSQDALSTLRRALTMAEPEGYVRSFVEQGHPMARLLYRAAEQGIQADYASRLLAAFELSATAPTTASMLPSAEGLIEPLSDREQQVLELIAQGYSNREIARSLSISLNTVKGHTRQIYGKLGVHSRTQAVAQARVLGLLPTQ